MTTEEKNKKLHQILGLHWHELVQVHPSEYNVLTCVTCGENDVTNPTYENPADVLRIIIELPMYPDFIGWAEGDIAYDGRCYMPIDYFLEKDKLLKTAIEYLKEKQRT